MIFGSGAVQDMHRRWIENLLPKEGVTYKNRSDDYHGLAISGPKSRELLSKYVEMMFLRTLLNLEILRYFCR